MQQHKPLTMRRNFSWTFAGNVIYAACQWGIMMVLTKLGSPEMVGQFTLGLAQAAPIFMLTNLQLRDIQATDAKHQYLFSDYLGLRLIGTGLALMLITVITLATGYRWETLIVILAISLAKSVESISDVFYGLMQQQERMDKIAISMVIRGLSSLLFLTVGFYLTHSVFWGVVGLTIAWFIALVAHDIRSGTQILKKISLSELESVSTNPKMILLRPRWHLKTLSKLAYLALPLGFSMMLISLNTNIPRYFIEHYLGERELGFFASMAYLVVLGNMVISSLAKSASPKLAKFYALGNSKAFQSLLLKLVGVAILVGSTVVLVATIAGREILSFLYQPEYGQKADVFAWLMVTAGISYITWFLGEGMTAIRYLRIQLPLYILVGGISTVTCFFLIPAQGLKGAAIALLIAAIVEVLLMLGIILHGLHKLRQKPKQKVET